MSRPARRAREALRHAALDVLSVGTSRGGRLQRSLREARVHNLYLHAVPPSEEPRLVELLDWLAATGHTAIPYSEGIDRTRRGDIDRPYVTFSFDDGYASNRRTGDLLAERGISACFFVVTDFIGRTDLASARALLGPGTPEPAMDWADIDHLRASGHEIGNHTRAHRNLANLSPDEVVDAVNVAADTLEERVGGAAHFAWPLGRWHHASSTVRHAVLARHESCASAERGAHPAGAGPAPDFCPRRDHLMTSWPLAHQQYFIARSARDAARLGAAAGGWPTTWA